MKTHDPVVTERVTTLLKQVNILAQEASKKYSVPVFIAGGSVRDAYLGLYPNDVDVFVDVSGADKDERDDLVLLVSTRVLDGLQHLYPESETKVHRTESELYKNLGTEWTIYNQPWSVFWEDAGFRIPLDDEDDDNDDDDIFPEQFGTQLQFIGRTEKTGSITDVLSSFDYSLVKAYVSPEENTLVYLPEFLKTLETRRITCDKAPNENTIIRVHRFLDRLADTKIDFLFDYKAESEKYGDRRYSSHMDKLLVEMGNAWPGAQAVADRILVDRPVLQRELGVAVPPPLEQQVINRAGQRLADAFDQDLLDRVFADNRRVRVLGDRLDPLHIIDDF